MSDSGLYVTKVNPNDVLFGRGSGPNDHEGNIKFRDMVASRKAEYLATNHRQTKAKIAKEVVDSVFACNGRFLKKLEPSEIQKIGFDASHDLYTLVDDDTIMEKAKQALRQNRDKGSAGTQGSLSPVPCRERSNAMPMRNTHSLPPSFVQGRNGQFVLPPASINPPIVYSAEPSDFDVEAEDYDEYTTTLDDLDEEDFCGTEARRMSVSSRRSSLLGGRKDGNGPRRDSLQMADVWKRDGTNQSMQMSEMMESFKGMSATGDFNSSSDTIGTIEGDVLGKSQMSMSVMSMASTTSLFKSNSSDKMSGSHDDIFLGLNNAVAWNSNAVMQPIEMPLTTSLRTSGAYSSMNMSNLFQGSLEGSTLALNYDTAGAGKPGQGNNSDR